MGRIYIKKNILITVLAPEIPKEEQFIHGYKCHKCGLRFSTPDSMQLHAKMHRPDLVSRPQYFSFKGKLVKSPIPIRQGICQIEGCPNTNTQLHHYAYDENNPAEYTIELCPKHHGKWHAEHTPNWGSLNKNNVYQFLQDGKGQESQKHND